MSPNSWSLHPLAPALASSLLVEWSSCWAAEERALHAAVYADLIPPSTVRACLDRLTEERQRVGDLLI